MSNAEDWAIDSNEAVQLTLYGPLSSAVATFHPDYTYPIFGDAETIYGYKGLNIELSLAAWDMRGYLKVNWDQKIDPSLGTEAEDTERTLKDYLPEGNHTSFECDLNLKIYSLMRTTSICTSQILLSSLLGK